MVQLRMKALFFETPRVQRAMEAATRQALSRAGAFGRWPCLPPMGGAGILWP